MADDANKTAEKLLERSKQAFSQYPKSCSHSTWYVIQQYKPDQPYMSANQLIHHITASSEWQ